MCVAHAAPAARLLPTTHACSHRVQLTRVLGIGQVGLAIAGADGINLGIAEEVTHSVADLAKRAPRWGREARGERGM
jgi:hypothetical protein